MDATTLVAMLILGGIFLLMTVTLVKYGVESAIKLWGGMGALTGVAFGSIISYYFTSKSNEQEIRKAQGETHAAISALRNAQQTAAEVNNEITQFVSALRGNNMSTQVNTDKKQIINSIPLRETASIVNRLEKASVKLSTITTDSILEGNYLTEAPAAAAPVTAIESAPAQRSSPVSTKQSSK